MESEVPEGVALIEETVGLMRGKGKKNVERCLHELHAAKNEPKQALAIASSEKLLEQMSRFQPRIDTVTHSPNLEIVVNRPRARFSAWYELFVRSQGVKPGKYGTFQDAERRLLDIQNMGFDVVYLTPIHPIGKTNRKGRNNSLHAGPDDPGSPWAIGSAQGGHMAIEPFLGTIRDFDRFVKKAALSAWYELFVRSQGVKPGKYGTFQDAERRLLDIQNMGFDVVYLTPIHPIGKTNRKGRNNSLHAGPDDPGSPWAIGSAQGGHMAIEPFLGTIRDFDRFVKKAHELGMEVALDFAIQTSPDHPWVKEHPEWFYHRPDGTIKYAENLPKKYEDIYPINFDTPDRDNLWEELYRTVLFWIEHGVKIFRVDNPHTKPFHFWGWLIRKVQDEHPDTIFLSEAFTRPTTMRVLAKLGFTNSYTYFTWRNSKQELIEYLTELIQSWMQDYFMPNFFANTPDILTEYLQTGGRPAFKIRLALAATLSPSYGIYSGFELQENEPLRPGSEEYMNSEKYEIKIRDWDRPGNIKDFIARVNVIRRENPALQEFTNLRFLPANNDQILFYGKMTSDRSNVILVAVNLDPFHPHHCTVSVPMEEIGLAPGMNFEVCDLLSGERYTWSDENYVRLDPEKEPLHILRVERWH